MLKSFELTIDPPQVTDYDPWYYPVVINGMQMKLGAGSTSSHGYLLKWQEYRDGVLGDSLLDKLDLQNKTLRDYACNCGYWGLRAAERGLKYYVGIEGREVFIRQGKQLWGQAEKRCPYQFILGNVVARAAPPCVDISFCIGILYHLPDWQSVLKQVMAATNDVIVIETRVHPAGTPRKYPGDLMFNRIEGVGTGAVQLPSLDEITKLLGAAGWGCIEILENLNEPDSIIPAGELFTVQRTQAGRVALIARK